MPEGKNVFVMRQKDIKLYDKEPKSKNIELWSPITGDCYFFENISNNETICGITISRDSSMTIRPNDPICPLKHIYSLVGPENIYANIQKYDFPVLMSFELTNKKKWKPLFVDKKHE